MEKKRYEIQSLEQLINTCNSENIDRISIDFLLWLNYVVKFHENLREKNPKMYEGVTNYEMTKPAFIWIDDGRHDFKKVQLRNTDTGEVTEIKIPKK